MTWACCVKFSRKQVLTPGCWKPMVKTCNIETMTAIFPLLRSQRLWHCSFHGKTRWHSIAYWLSNLSTVCLDGTVGAGQWDKSGIAEMTFQGRALAKKKAARKPQARKNEVKRGIRLLKSLQKPG